MRRAAAVANSPILPLSETHQTSPKRRRKRQQQRASNDWLVLNRTTVVALSGLGVLAFCFVHIYLLHNIVMTSSNSSLDLSPVVRDDGKLVLSTLRVPTDYQQYTIRINTWQRLETLKVSLEHHASCPGVAQIQVVWCTAQGPPPDWLLSRHDEKVVIEEHTVNSLNERFVMQKVPPTAAVLSLDDDILRPCVAYDWAFYQWTQNPDRIMGFDARSHEVVQGDDSGNDAVVWKYAYMSTTEKTNRYSLTLTRCCFLHADYLPWYATSPQIAPIREFVKEHLNCEDIGMSMAVSSQTDGKPPLIADFWVVKSMVKLDDGSNQKISAGKDHKKERDQCVNQFADHLQLKGRLQQAKLKHGQSFFEYGDEHLNWNVRPEGIDVSYLVEAVDTVNRWKADPRRLAKELAELRLGASSAAYEAGLVEKTEPWKQRFHKKKDDSHSF